MKSLALALALVFTSPAAIAQRAAAPIDAPAGSSHYRITLTADTYRALARRDMGDLRILNAAGEPVPFAFVTGGKPQQAPVEKAALTLYPLHGDRARGMDAVSVRVEHRGGATTLTIAGDGAATARVLLGYLADASGNDEPMHALELQWRASETFNGSVRVESSDDLKRWSDIAGAPVISLEHGGERLVRNRVELPASRTKYLRLSFRDVPADFVLTGLSMERRGQAADVPRQWAALRGTGTAKRGEYAFESDGRFPLDRLRLALPQPNTVAALEVLARERADDPWRLVAAATAYRLMRDGREVTSPDIAFAAATDRLWLVRASEKGGGLGAGELKAEAGWLPHTLVFAARGAPPFSLEVGDPARAPAALPAASVIPDYRDGKEIAAGAASVGAVTVRPRGSIFEDPRAWLGSIEARDARKWALWSVLVIGVLAVAWMAFRLLRDMGR